MIISPFEVKKSLFPKKFVQEAERGTCHLDLRGVPPCPPSTWKWEKTEKQDKSENKDRQQAEESE